MTGTSLRGRDLVSAADLSAEDIGVLFARAAELKAEYAVERWHAGPPLERRTLAMLFQRPSLRTRVTFEAGMTQLGGHAICLAEGVVLGGRETVGDVARNLETFVDGIMARTGPHEVVVELAAQASIPVINGLTIREHPCQALVPGQPGPAGGRARRARDALSAGPPGRGDHVRRDGRPEEHHLRAVGEPAARPEGAPGGAARGVIDGARRRMR